MVSLDVWRSPTFNSSMSHSDKSKPHSRSAVGLCRRACILGGQVAAVLYKGHVLAALWRPSLFTTVLHCDGSEYLWRGRVVQIT